MVQPDKICMRIIAFGIGNHEIGTFSPMTMYHIFFIFCGHDSRAYLSKKVIFDAHYTVVFYKDYITHT